ncbi:uncharacterized protein PHALS_01987 [Plasmopara halstedii]|uniref:Uncharacterized protein n=1 Tax=Plasmopara halstedii TaxID=4781 RepID=A0A0P1ATQ3_PLAHL|nr:uncharacterized protein PHALS_01987 [Plasmopara halstedii]CEG45706.1 hypothetical protein PHALS_01987 [Plasmopara halstedii]|eukprot:XP_024582075.1 hypothetical protein PHALS_01987 [Plasmopara halstedii]
MSPKRSRTTYHSALTDNARPGGPTTMDMLVRWITKPGNVKRWRLEPRAPLIREVVDAMQEEGLAHRQPPFVRYKLIAIEKQYMTAQKWLLETGMHDAYMKGKATKEVRVHVDNLCPHFQKLDPAFRSVPFGKERAETIELDEFIGEGNGAAERQEMEEIEMAKKVAKPMEKRNTFRDRLLVNKDKNMTLKERQKKASRLEKQIAPSPGYAAARKSLTTGELQENNNTSKKQVSNNHVAEIRGNPTAVQPKAAVAMSEKNVSASAQKRAGRPSHPPEDLSSSMTYDAREIVNGTKEAASRVPIAEREVSDERRTEIQRKRLHEQARRDGHDISKIERGALLKRVNDEEKQRQEVYSLERAKLECELEAKKVQLLFEKAAARQKLDQLGVSQAEIDRIFPL